MHSATLNHIHLINNPDINLASKITLDEAGARRLMQIKFLAFGRSDKCYLILFAGA
jgi:ethanolamine utilization microcompartment shell protein EutS